jgi:hypothetical protein
VAYHDADIHLENPMKDKFKNILIVCGIFLNLNQIFADSPLTSTSFSSAYLDITIVSIATQSNGILNPNLIDYLNAENPIEIKIAIINALGWNIKGKNNSNIYLQRLFELKKYRNLDDIEKNGTPDQLICLAYLKAMDNYFKVDSAIIYADLALQRNPQSLSVNMIAALIKAQKALSGDWCNVFKMFNNVRRNQSLNKDFRQQAVDLIFKYIDSYKKYCKS